ncbi:MAG: Ig-like domain-containing protein [Prevotella sp.]|nr:Ig-like domain-containing protein [Prevotella sp.]
MKKTIYLKSFLLLCLFLAGVVNAHADGYDYDCVKVTDLSQLEGGETVLLVDQSKKLALSPRGETYGLKGVEIAIDEDNVIRNMPANIIWTIENPGYNSFSLKNNGDYLWGSLTTNSVSVSNSSTDATNEFKLDYNYGADSGKLYYEGNQGPAYFSWSANEDKLIVIGDNTEDNFTLYKITVKNYVKWKLVDGINVTASKNDLVAIVDTNTGMAMSNDKGDKAPDAVAVTLNDDKDRLLGEVPEKLQWSLSWGTDRWFSLEATDGNLYADSDGLKVGKDKQCEFMPTTIDGVKYMRVSVNSTDYLAGVEASMFSNTWILKELKNNKPDDKVKDTRFAIFKKIEDPQKIVNIELPEYYNYDFNKVSDYPLAEYDFNEKVAITGADKSEIKWKSSNPDVAEINAQGAITLKKRGTTVITAYVEEDTEDYYHDKASAKCTVIVDDNRTADLGTIRHPLTVKEAKELAETGEIKIDNDIVVLTLEEGVNYYIKGKVSKVNSGMMAMFGDMDFGEMMGGSGSGMSFEDSMDDMDFDPEDMEESGFDMSSFDMSSLGFDLSAMFGTSDKVTYYISDDGTKDGQMKVINGCGTLTNPGTGTMEFNPIPKLSPGDCVVVCGPLINTEDTNMFSSMMGGNNSEEPKMSGKVDEMNYLAVYDPTLLVEDKEIYVNKSLKVVDGGYTNYTLEKGLYSIDNLFNKYDGYYDEVKITDLSQIKEATFKSSDEDIVKWDDEKKELVGVNEGKAKITVKVKVVLQEADDQADPKVEEKSYTMKRKFKVIVKTRDLDPAGYYDGEWKLTTSLDDLKEGTRLVLVGTRVKEDKETAEKTYTDYMMVENNAMMGGGKNGSKIEFDDSNKETIPSSTVISKKGLEVVLEQAEDGTSWYLNVGTDENDTPLYLYASVKEESSNTGDQQSTSTTGTGGGGFNMDEMMEMFNPSSGLKVGTKEGTTSKVEGVDSLKATITIADNIATIKFPAVPDDKNNTIMLSSSFDMESMMEMFGGMGGNKEEEENPDEPTEDEPTEEKSTFDMGSFDMFMASFNTKKSGDEQPTVDEETGETKAPKCFMPRIYRFVPYASYKTAISSAEWKTIVSYKDVSVPEDVEAYVVTKVVPGEDRSKAVLKEVEDKQLKGGEPYLLHSASGNYELTLLTPYAPDELPAPEKNLLLVSNKLTSSENSNTPIYVLSNKSNGVGFYKWTGGELGSGRVYLPMEANVEGAAGFCAFFADETTIIQTIDSSEMPVGPYYDLQGRRVLKPTKGVYVVDGKKVIIK